MREPPDEIGVRSIEEASDLAEEARLLEAVRRGDDRAFDRIARAHAPRMYRLAVHLAGDPGEAEDLVQETLVRTLPRLDRFEGRARLSTYLLRSLANLWKNRLRSKSRSKVVPWPRAADAEDRPVEFPDPRPSAENGLAAHDRAARVRAALLRLEPTRRLTLLLREIEGRSYEEIAEVTGVPVGTVRSRLARARADMRAILGGRP